MKSVAFIKNYMMNKILKYEFGKIRIAEIAFMLSLIFCGFYVTDYNINILHFPLVYLFEFIASFLLFLVIALKGNFVIKKYSLFLIVLIVINSWQMVYLPNDWLVNYKLLVIPIALFLPSLILTSFNNCKTIVKTSKYCIYFSTSLLIFELILRIKNAENQGWFNYFEYKFHTILWSDSNVVAIFINQVYCFCLYLENYLNKNTKYIKKILFVLVLFTFSRGGIATFVICSLLFNYKKIIVKYRLVSYCIILLLTFGLYLFLCISPDIYGSRAQIALRAFNNQNNLPICYILFGDSVGSTAFVAGKGAHNIVSTFYCELGIVGMVVWLVFFGILIEKSRGKALYLVIPLFINGLGQFTFACTYFWIMVAVICNLESSSKRVYLIGGNNYDL